jgi:hypothetical protein
VVAGGQEGRPFSARYRTVKARYTTVKTRYKTLKARYKTVKARYKRVKVRYEHGTTSPDERGKAKWGECVPAACGHGQGVVFNMVWYYLVGRRTRGRWRRGRRPTCLCEVTPVGERDCEKSLQSSYTGLYSPAKHADSLGRTVVWAHTTALDRSRALQLTVLGPWWWQVDKRDEEGRQAARKREQQGS